MFHLLFIRTLSFHVRLILVDLFPSKFEPYEFLTFYYSYVSSFFVFWPTSVVHVNYTGINSIYSNFWSVVQYKYSTCISTIILDHFNKFIAIIFSWHSMSHNANQRPDMYHIRLVGPGVCLLLRVREVPGWNPRRPLKVLVCFRKVLVL